MKSNKVGLVFIVGVILTLSCSAQVDTKLDDFQAETEAITESVNQDSNAQNWSADWNDFKKAIREKNTEDLKKRSTDNITDYESLIYMLSELYVMRKMDETAFEQLESVTVEEVAYLQFYAEDVGIDEFGYEYATAITLYFVTKQDGLYLADYSAAG